MSEVDSQYVIYGYIVPETFLIERGLVIFNALLDIVTQEHAHTEAPCASPRVPQKQQIHQTSLEGLPSAAVPTHIDILGIGARDVMLRARLLEQPRADVPTLPNNITATPAAPFDTRTRLPETPRPPPVRLSVHAGTKNKLSFHLCSPHARLVLVRLRARDDDLGVREVDYAIALASNDPEDGLPGPKDDWKPVIECVERLRRVLGAGSWPIWYPAVKGNTIAGVPIRGKDVHRESFGLESNLGYMV